jgi:hypothetical protein
MRDFWAKLSNKGETARKRWGSRKPFSPQFGAFRVHGGCKTFAAIRGTFARCLQRRRHIIEERDGRPVTVGPKKRATLCATCAKVTFRSLLCGIPAVRLGHNFGGFLL